MTAIFLLQRSSDYSSGGRVTNGEIEKAEAGKTMGSFGFYSIHPVIHRLAIVYSTDLTTIYRRLSFVP